MFLETMQWNQHKQTQSMRIYFCQTSLFLSQPFINESIQIWVYLWHMLPKFTQISLCIQTGSWLIVLGFKDTSTPVGHFVSSLSNKKSAESDVAPAEIKSYKFLFVLKKIYFAVFKKLIG